MRFCRLTIILFLVLLDTAFTAWAQETSGKLGLIAQTKNFWQLFLINEDGTGLRQIARSPVDKSKVSWSKDQGRLLVNTAQGELFIVDIATGAEKKLDIGIRGMTDAVWSADGKKVLFSLSIANSIDNNDIWLVDIATRKRQKLTWMKHLQHNPVWTPEGKHVVFLSGAGGQSHDIWILDLHTGSVRQITFGQLYNFEPACSVNNEIAFSSNRTGDYEIWVCDFKGTKFEQLTHSPGLDSQPSWSPDGNKIAFVSTRDGEMGIWIMGRDGGNLKRLTPPGLVSRAPAWSK